MMVSEGSAAMPLSCNDHFVANFVLSLAVKEFRKSINIFREVIDTSRVSCFLTHTV